MAEPYRLTIETDKTDKVTAFASDNTAPVHQIVLDAIAEANHGSVRAYGDDPYTAACEASFQRLFEAPVEVLLVWGGTGANIVGLGSVLHNSEAVICTSDAHISVDEGGGPERFLGAKLIDVVCDRAKLTPGRIDAQLHVLGDPHHVQPRVVSLTQATELSTIYQPGELREIAELAHSRGLLVHMDGARIANAVASLGGDLHAATEGVDILSFGGTKNGMMYGEAVIFLTPALSKYAAFVRKQATQLPSKARYIAAQFNVMIDTGLWLDNARNANAMARRLYDAVVDLGGVSLDGPPEANALFPCLPAAAISELQRRHDFYVWDPARNQVRWMTSWSTTSEEVDEFARDVRRVLSLR